MSQKKINVAIVGVGFGSEFISIYQKHPNANMLAICQRNIQKLNEGISTFHLSRVQGMADRTLIW